MLTKRIMIGLVATVVAVGGGAGYAAESGLVVGGPTSHPDAKPPVAALPEGVATHFGVFRRPATAQDQPASSLASPGDYAKGVNGSLARKALTTAGGDTVYLVPSTDGVCMQSSLHRATGCTSVAAADTGQGISSIVCSPYLPTDTLEVDGILPDGASNVTSDMSDGTRMPITVTNNAFVLDVPRSGPLPTTIEWDDASGHHTASSSVPDDAASTNCAPPPPISSK